MLPEMFQGLEEISSAIDSDQFQQSKLGEERINKDVLCQRVANDVEKRLNKCRERWRISTDGLYIQISCRKWFN